MESLTLIIREPKLITSSHQAEASCKMWGEQYHPIGGVSGTRWAFNTYGRYTIN